MHIWLIRQKLDVSWEGDWRNSPWKWGRRGKGVICNSGTWGGEDGRRPKMRVLGRSVAVGQLNARVASEAGYKNMMLGWVAVEVKFRASSAHDRHHFYKACPQHSSVLSPQTLYVVHGRARPVLRGPNSTEPNLFHHGETSYRVGWLS